MYVFQYFTGKLLDTFANYIFLSQVANTNITLDLLKKIRFPFHKRALWEVQYLLQWSIRIWNDIDLWNELKFWVVH